MTAAPAFCHCRACGTTFENPYTVGESYLCDGCLRAPMDEATFKRIRELPPGPASTCTHQPITTTTATANAVIAAPGDAAPAPEAQ